MERIAGCPCRATSVTARGWVVSPEVVSPEVPSPRRPRVVHVVRSLEIGGLERLVCDLVEESERVLPVAVICLTRLGELGEEMQRRGREVVPLGMGERSVGAVWRLARHLRRLRAEVVHCHNLMSHLYGSLAARLAGVDRVFFTKHGTHLPGPTLTNRLNNWLLKSSQTIAVSQHIQSICLRELRLPPPSVHYVPNGLSLRPYSALPARIDARQLLKWPVDGYYLGVVARLARGKGHAVLLEAFRQLAAGCPAARLVIVGDGPERDAVREQVGRLDLGDRVILTGSRTDVPQILAALDAFVLPSFDEGLPMTVLEAMAARLPVISTTVGDIPHVVAHGETGLLVPPGAPDQLAEAIRAMYDAPARAHAMGGRGRERLEARFDMRATASRYESLYLA